jgi:CarD family transcriptional regulator
MSTPDGAIRRRAKRRPDFAASLAYRPRLSVRERNDMSSKSGLEFKVGDAVVYPAHGVGKVAAVETQEVAGMSLEVYVVTFDHEKMTLRVPTKKAKTAGLRSLAGEDIVTKALTTLKGRARVKRTMWSRRAQEYEAKINSGDLISIAEVVRDLHRADTQPEQSYSERQLYESALDRMAREVAAANKIDKDAAVALLGKSLSAKKAVIAAPEAAEEAEAA